MKPIFLFVLLSACIVAVQAKTCICAKSGGICSITCSCPGCNAGTICNNVIQKFTTIRQLDNRTAPIVQSFINYCSDKVDWPASSDSHSVICPGTVGTYICKPCSDCPNDNVCYKVIEDATDITKIAGSANTTDSSSIANIAKNAIVYCQHSVNSASGIFKDGHTTWIVLVLFMICTFIYQP
jgi:hypothetical protein